MHRIYSESLISFEFLRRGSGVSHENAPGIAQDGAGAFFVIIADFKHRPQNGDLLFRGLYDKGSIGIIEDGEKNAPIGAHFFLFQWDSGFIDMKSYTRTRVYLRPRRILNKQLEIPRPGNIVNLVFYRICISRSRIDPSVDKNLIPQSGNIDGTDLITQAIRNATQFDTVVIRSFSSFTQIQQTVVRSPGQGRLDWVVQRRFDMAVSFTKEPPGEAK